MRVTPLHLDRPLAVAIALTIALATFACGGDDPHQPERDAPTSTHPSDDSRPTGSIPDRSATAPDATAPDATAPDATAPRSDIDVSEEPPSSDVTEVVLGPEDFSAVSATVTTAVNTGIEIGLEGSGPQGIALVYEVARAPDSGLLHGAAPDLEYVPDDDFVGQDSFEFTVGNADVRSAPATVSVSVLALPNRPPVADDLQVDAAAERDTVIRLVASDPDGDELTYRIVDEPEHGVVSLDEDLATYTPDAGFSGQDSFTYVASDGELNSDPATVTLDVLPLENRPPVAEDFAVSLDQRSSTTFDLRGFDLDGEPLTWEIVAQPQHGVITLNGRTATYTPEPAFHGEDAFTYRVSDGEHFSEPATVSITVNFVNRPPVALDANLSGDQRTSFSRTLTATDPDGDDVTLEIVDDPRNGTATLDGLQLTYTPDADFFGQDLLTFRAFDGELLSAPATVTVTVRYVNRPPVASAVSDTVPQGSSTLIALDATDPDGDPLSFAIADPPAIGSASIVGAFTRLDLTGDPDFHGEVTFTYTASDGQATSAPAEVRVNVQRATIPPTARDLSLSTQRDSPLTFDLDGSGDPEATLTFTVAEAPAHGSVTLDGNAATYTPDASFLGEDTFTFTVSDGEVVSSPATVTITVTPRNRPPVARDIAVTVPQREGGTFALDGSDPDDDPIEFRIVENPQHGTLVVIGDEATYIPDGDFFGEDDFLYQAFDGELFSDPATATITVAYVNRPPTAEDREAEALSGQPVQITLVATDPDDDPLTFALADGPASGTVDIDGDTATYTPSGTFFGSDAFTYVAQDGTTNSAPATVMINVRTVPPAASSTTYVMVAETTTLTIDAEDGLRTAVEPGTVPLDELVFVLLEQPESGVVLISPDGSFTFEASNASLELTDAFDFRVIDPSGQFAIATVTITRPAGP
ncbi:MAG: tandem-95 repeat protein [Deltaproteobacteria bacterium]|nr:MAG: tandem-95 repeat protein [Deltaproteobacteria bacterium]